MIKEFNKYNKLNEYFNSDYRYETIFIEIKNLEELNEVKEYLKERIYPFLDYIDKQVWDDGMNSISYLIRTSPYYIKINNSYNLYQFSYGRIEFINMNDYEFKYEKIFTIDDVRNDFLNMIFKYGISSSPSYNPRKIDRSLNESSESLKYKYEDIYIRLNSIDDVDQIKKYIDKIISQFKLITDLDYTEIFEYIKHSIEYEEKPYYVHIILKNYPTIDFGFGSINFFNSECSESYFKYTFEKLFIMKDVRNNFLEDIFKYGKYIPKPNYNPRKIDKEI